MLLPPTKFILVEGDRGGGNTGVMGAGSLWEVGEERVGDRIPKGAGARSNRKSILQHCAIFRNRKSTQAGTTTEGGGNQEYKVREAGNSDPLGGLNFPLPIDFPPSLLPGSHPHVKCYPHYLKLDSSINLSKTMKIFSLADKLIIIVQVSMSIHYETVRRSQDLYDSATHLRAGGHLCVPSNISHTATLTVSCWMISLYVLESPLHNSCYKTENKS